MVEVFEGTHTPGSSGCDSSMNSVEVDGSFEGEEKTSFMKLNLSLQPFCSVQFTRIRRLSSVC